jgi:hypothetical protein
MKDSIPAVGDVIEVEVERRRAPEVAPPLGEDLGATALLDGEEGDYLSEDLVGEAADAVNEIFIWSASVVVTRSRIGRSRRWRRTTALRRGGLPLPCASTVRLHLLWTARN